jgi:mycothiol system anti-sigma-R factor
MDVKAVVRHQGTARSPGGYAAGLSRPTGGTDMEIYTCNDVNEWLYDALDQELCPEEETDLNRHLARCLPCREHVEFERQFLAAIRATCRASRAPEGLLEKIHRSLEGL